MMTWSAGVLPLRLLAQLAVALAWLVMLPTAAAALLAGAAKVDISPTQFPVIVNGMFTERTANRVVDPLLVRALVIEKGPTRIALVVVDTCMMPRELIDDAKARASRSTGIPTDRMLISATHTHSAPAAMGCLGSRMDPRYAASLPSAIARAIQDAASVMEPVQIGWASFDATGFTHNRRWIRRSDRVELDPFGERTVRAHMHPGHVSPHVIGPSGPVDPAFTLLSLVRTDGTPLALYGNFSMHYYESEMTSSDYFGRWCNYMEGTLSQEQGRMRNPSKIPIRAGSQDVRPVVALLSQGTSGDLMYMDYSRPRNYIGYDAYARALSERALATWRGIEHRSDVALDMREAHLPLVYRVADAPRLAWARELAAKIGDRLPQTQPEIYALEQMELKRREKTELVLQAVRIGDLAITALPNEVFALTGLKLKTQSPLALTMNVELANGAEGYIPPPEQHALGGYTTWAARTAGLETNAEPRIVATLLQLLEAVSQRPRKVAADPESGWSRALRATRPAAYWKLDEQSTGSLHNQFRNAKATARLEGRHALYLDGVDRPAPKAHPNHALHLVDGRVLIRPPSGGDWTLSGWFWNGFPTNAAAECGELIKRGDASTGWRLWIAGTNGPAGRLQLQSHAGTQSGSTQFGVGEWHHVATVSKRGRLIVYLDGIPELECAVEVGKAADALTLGGGGGAAPLQGKLDEVAWHTRALSAGELKRLVACVGR